MMSKNVCSAGILNMLQAFDLIFRELDKMLYCNGNNDEKRPEHLGKLFSIMGAFIAFGRNLMQS